MPDHDHVAEEAARLVAVARAEPGAGTTRGASITLRFTKGSDLLAWFERYGNDHDISRNRALLVALASFRAAVERGEAEGNHP
jgi:hypothetical protein